MCGVFFLKFHKHWQVWHFSSSTSSYPVLASVSSVSKKWKSKQTRNYLGAFPFILTPYINFWSFDQSVYNWRDEPRADYPIFTSFSGLPINNRYGKIDVSWNTPQSKCFQAFQHLLNYNFIYIDSITIKVLSYFFLWNPW